METGAREVAVLAALARGTLGRDFVAEVPGRMLGTIGQLASSSDRRQLITVLKALSTRGGALALTGRAIPVSWLSAEEAESLLQKWKASRIHAQRQLCDVFTSVASISLYGYPGPHWDRIGYPGPMGPPPSEPRRLSPLPIDHDETLTCDAVVVGSGAGGGCVAAHLAGQGLDVIVLEKGGYRSETDYHHREADSLREMYLYGMTLATTDLGCRIIAGSTLGGGTVVNYTTSFRTPDHVLEEWAGVSGIPAFTSGEFQESLDEVSVRLGVNTDSSAAGKRDVVMEEGLKKLGWHVDLLPRAVRGCAQDEACGYCGFGCRSGAKQSTMRTYLEDAAASGARMVVGADVRKVIVKDGGASGVIARCRGRKLRIDARAVVVAAGSIESPALLLRSGLGGQVGRNLRLHPGTAPFGTFDDEVRMWEGTLQARYSKEFRDWDGGYGPIFETVPVHPGAGSTALPWTSAEQHRATMDNFSKVSFCAVLSRDQAAGRVRIGRDGNPRVEYRTTSSDERRITEGVIAAARVLEAAGANEIKTTHAAPIAYRPDGAGGHERWAEDVRTAGYGPGKVTFFSYHQMGSCRMGTDPATSAIDANNETHEVKNLFVTDGSAFPTASGVNPMLSIYAIANRAAKTISQRLS